MIFINLVTDTMLLFAMIYRAIDIPGYWLTNDVHAYFPRASKLCLRKMAEHLDFDKNCLLKKVLPNWSYGPNSDTWKDASTKRTILYAECWKSQKRKSINCKRENTSNLFSHSMKLVICGRANSNIAQL